MESTDEANEIYVVKESSPEAELLYTTLPTYSAASASQRETSLSSAVLSHLASAVPSPRVVLREREENERPARVSGDDLEDVPSQINLRIQRVKSSACHSHGLIVDSDVAEGKMGGELKSMNKHVGGSRVGQPRGEREQSDLGTRVACLLCEIL